MSLDRDRVADAIRAELLEREILELADAQEVAEDVCDRLRLGGKLPEVSLPASAESRLYDLRRQQVRAHRKTRRRNGRTVKRDLWRITGIVLHQTAVEYGVSERQVRAARGDRDLALARRALAIGAHVTAFRSGFFVAAHPLENYVHHGHGLNGCTLGLEVDGRYPGLEDDPATVPREDLETTWGGPPTELTTTTIETARAALRWLVETARAEGMPIRDIYAHRQSKRSRKSDPGQALWREVALWGVHELGLRTRPRVISRDGRPVPVEWQADGVGGYE